jgi:signal peptidase
VISVEGSPLSRYGFVTFGRGTTLTTISIAIVLVTAFCLIVLEPGFVFGFTRNVPSFFGLGFFLFTAPVVAVAEEGIYRGYIFKSLATTGPINSAIFISSLLYAVQLTNPFVLGGLGLGGATQYVFTNTLTPFALGIVMCLYYYKSSWSLLGPVIVRTGLVLQGNLSPVFANTTGWEFTFVFQLMGLAAMILLINVTVKEPRFLARRYLGMGTGPKKWRFLRRARARREVKAALKTLAMAGIAVALALLAFEAVLGSSVHLVAIPTGSMRPALDPGALVLVQSTSAPNQIQLGDIVEYKALSVNEDVVHRVIGIQQGSEGVLFITKGDNNTSPDPAPVPYANVIGKVVFAVPFLGFFVLSPPLDITAMLFLFVASLLGSSLKSPKQSLKLRSMG